MIWVAMVVGLEAGNGVLVSVGDAGNWVGKVDVGVTFAQATKLMQPTRNVIHLHRYCK